MVLFLKNNGLEGSIRKVYVYMVSKAEPVGIREIARELNLPVSTVHYAVKRLIKLGLVKKVETGYIVDKVIDFNGYVLLRRKYIPLSFVYAGLFIGVLMGELYIVFLKGINADRFVTIIIAIIAIFIFIVEGIKKLREE